MDFRLTKQQEEIRRSVREVCEQYPDEYWRELDRDRRYPEEFVEALTRSGWLSALIPEEYGGMGFGVTEAAIILEEINRSGANAGACHAQMYTMGTLLRHGSEEQKRACLPKIAAGDRRLQAFGVTEHTAGTDTTRIETMAVRDGDVYVVNGHKNWTSRARHSDLLLLLARTTPYERLTKKTEGLSTLLVDLSTHCIGGHRGRAVVRRPGQWLRDGAGGLRPPHRPEPGDSVPHRAGPRFDRGGQHAAVQS